MQHDMTEILLKVALSTITLTYIPFYLILSPLKWHTFTDLYLLILSAFIIVTLNAMWTRATNKQKQRYNTNTHVTVPLQT